MATVAIAALAVSACASSITGRPRVIDANGVPVYKENNVKDGQIDPGNGKALRGLQARFFRAHAALKQDGKDAPENLKRFLESGFALVHLGCNAYIEGKSDRQRKVNTVRDSFVPFTALVTGLIGVANDGDTDSDALTVLSLLTSASSAGFEIYEQRFLFGADNVDEVRSLVLRAQAAHSAIAYTDIEKNPSYEQAVIHLMHNQMVCSPAHILRLVNEAIDKGEVKAIERAAVSVEKTTRDGDQTKRNTESVATEDKLKVIEVGVE